MDQKQSKKNTVLAAAIVAALGLSLPIGAINAEPTAINISEQKATSGKGDEPDTGGKGDEPDTGGKGDEPDTGGKEDEPDTGEIVKFSEPTAIKMSAQKATISNASETNAGTAVKLWFVDANGNMTSSGADYSIDLSSSDTTVIGNSTLSISAGATSAMLNVGGNNADVAVLGLGSTSLTAVASIATQTTSLSSAAVPLTIVENYLRGTSNFSSGATAGVSIANAFSVSTNDGASYAGNVDVAHSIHGIAGHPTEILPASLVNNTAGSLALAFTQASGTITIANDEYYVISDPSGVLGDAVVTNAGADTDSDIKAAAVSGVEMRGSNGLPLTILEATGNVATVPTASLVPVDVFGNAIPDFTVSISGMVSATGTIDTVDNNVVNYTSAVEDDLTVNFSSPASASLDLNVVPVGTMPSISDAIVWDTAIASFTVNTSNTSVKGGININGGLHQLTATAGLGDKFNFSGTVSASATSKSVAFVWWSFVDGTTAFFDLGALLKGTDIGTVVNPVIELGNVNNALNLALADLEAIGSTSITFPSQIDASILGYGSTVYILMGHQEANASVVTLGLTQITVR